MKWPKILFVPLSRITVVGVNMKKLSATFVRDLRTGNQIVRKVLRLREETFPDKLEQR